MNLSELARKIRVPMAELRLKLPAMGFDIGGRAIKVDNRVASKIMADWKNLNAKYEADRKKDEAEEEEVVDKTAEKQIVKIPEFITVRDFSARLGIGVTKVLGELMKNGVLASMNENIDFDTAAIIASELNFEVEQDTTDATHKQKLSTS